MQRLQPQELLDRAEEFRGAVAEQLVGQDEEGVLSEGRGINLDGRVEVERVGTRLHLGEQGVAEVRKAVARSAQDELGVEGPEQRFVTAGDDQDPAGREDGRERGAGGALGGSGRQRNPVRAKIAIIRERGEQGLVTGDVPGRGSAGGGGGHQAMGVGESSDPPMSEGDFGMGLEPPLEEFGARLGVADMKEMAPAHGHSTSISTSWPRCLCRLAIRPGAEVTSRTARSCPWPKRAIG